MLFLIVTMSSCATRTRLSLPGLAKALEAHEELNLRRTRIAFYTPGPVIDIQLHILNDDILLSDDFTMGSLIAIVDTVGEYMQSERFIEYFNNYSSSYCSLLYELLQHTFIDVFTASGERLIFFSFSGTDNFEGGWFMRRTHGQHVDIFIKGCEEYLPESCFGWFDARQRD